jgi:dihydropteroate synthase
MIGTLTGRPVERRTPGSIGAAIAAVVRGARMIRTHDVGDTVDALTVAWSILAKTNEV